MEEGLIGAVGSGTHVYKSTYHSTKGYNKTLLDMSKTFHTQNTLTYVGDISQV